MKTKKRIKALESEITRLDNIINGKSKTPIRDAMAAEMIIDLDREINWDKPGQLVEHNNVVVMTSGKHTAKVFTGMQVSNTNTIAAFKGKATSDYQKHLFKPSNLTLKLCHE